LKALKSKNIKLTTNITELALELMRQNAQHKEALKINAATLAAKQKAA
jgi:hypothetical protein